VQRGVGLALGFHPAQLSTVRVRERCFPIALSVRDQRAVRPSRVGGVPQRTAGRFCLLRWRAWLGRSFWGVSSNHTSAAEILGFNLIPMAPRQVTHLEIAWNVPQPLQPMTISTSPRTVGSIHIESQGDRKTDITKRWEITVDQAGVVFI